MMIADKKGDTENVSDGNYRGFVGSDKPNFG